MNEEKLLDAIGGIRSQYILSAQKRLGILEEAPKHRSPGRGLLTLIAAVMCLVALATVAVAASPELRDAVFSFFRSDQTEVIPPESTTQETVPPTEAESLGVVGEGNIGGVIHSTYVQAPAKSFARNGLFYVVTDEVMMNSGNHTDAYREENGEFIQLEKHYFSQDYTLLGKEFHVEFEWVEGPAGVGITYVDPRSQFYVPGYCGPLEASLFVFRCPEGEYPVLINVKTGELTDVLAGTGVEKLARIQNSFISADQRGMLLYCEDDTVYYVDIADKKLYNLAQLSGEPLDACVLTENSIICWVLEGDSIEEATLGSYRVWVIDCDTFQRRDILACAATASTSYEVYSMTYEIYEEQNSLWDEHYGYELPPLTDTGLVFLSGFDGMHHWGHMYTGSPYALEVDAERNVWVIHLETGDKWRVPDFTWPESAYSRTECLASPDGKKAVLYVRDAVNYFTQVGIFDFEDRSFTQFSRENLSQINEHTVYWFDNDRVIIGTTTKGDYQEFYLYEIVK